MKPWPHPDDDPDRPLLLTFEFIGLAILISMAVAFTICNVVN